MNKKEIAREKRHRRIRVKVTGTEKRPRLIVRRSVNNIFAQVIDDTQNKTLFSLSTLDKEVKAKAKSGGNIKAAQALGEIFALRAKEKRITAVIFDRGGYLYHGRIKALAESLRKGGLDF